MDKEYLKNFKDGVADALLNGNMAEKYSDGYKQGYDFGLTMYQRLSEENDDELSGAEDKKLPQWLQWKLAELYEMAKKIDPDTASVISMAEDTLRKSK